MGFGGAPEGEGSRPRPRQQQSDEQLVVVADSGRDHQVLGAPVAKPIRITKHTPAVDGHDRVNAQLQLLADLLVVAD
jgi:hypothetical protein